jgi:enoyl-CoA hydratase/carnithine racemase
VSAWREESGATCWSSDPIGLARSTYAAIGLTSDGGMCWTLPRAVDAIRARDRIHTNRAVLAAEAEVIGLVSGVVDAQDRVRRLTAFAELVDGATGALGVARDLVLGGLARASSSETARERERFR